MSTSGRGSTELSLPPRKSCSVGRLEVSEVQSSMHSCIQKQRILWLGFMSDISLFSIKAVLLAESKRLIDRLKSYP